MRYLIAVLLLASPVMAQAPPVCPPQTMLPVIIAQVLENGGEFIALVDTPQAKDVTQMLILRIGHSVVVGMVKDNCVVSPPIPLMEAKFSKTSLGV